MTQVISILVGVISKIRKPLESFKKESGMIQRKFKQDHSGYYVENRVQQDSAGSWETS